MGEYAILIGLNALSPFASSGWGELKGANGQRWGELTVKIMIHGANRRFLWDECAFALSWGELNVANGFAPSQKHQFAP